VKANETKVVRGEIKYVDVVYRVQRVSAPQTIRPTTRPIVSAPAQPVQPRVVAPTAAPRIVYPTATPYVARVAPPAQPQQTGVRYGAICKDGTQSSATGRGACSHHGGVAYWLTR